MANRSLIFDSAGSRRAWWIGLTLLFAATFSAGCTIYQSSDRENFNSRALQGAPRTQKAEPTSARCATERAQLPQDSNWIRLSENDAYVIERTHADRVQIDFVSLDSSTQTAVRCAFVYSAGPSAEDLLNVSRELTHASLAEHVAATRLEP